jgi:hypothetical protein
MNKDISEVIDSETGTNLCCFRETDAGEGFDNSEKNPVNAVA